MYKYSGKILQRVDSIHRNYNNSKLNTELYIIEPGYILNKDAYKIWRFLDEEIEYDDLFEKIKAIFNIKNNKMLNEKLEKILDSFYERALIKVDRKVITFNNIINTSYFDEDDFINSFKVRPITQVDLVLTNKCNFRCKHCFIKSENLNGTTTIDIDSWKKALLSLSRFGLFSINITGGEPLTYNGIEEIIDYAELLGLRVQLLTNAYLINEEFVKKLSKYNNIIVQVSIDGSNQETYERQRGLIGSFNKCIRNVELLIANGVDVVVAMVLNKYNINDIYDESMVNLCKKIGVKYLVLTPNVIEFSSAIDNSEMFLNAEEAYNVVKYINNKNKVNAYGDITVNVSVPPALTDENSLSLIRKERPRCRRGTNSFSIRPNGNVYICTDFAELGYKDYYLGNILYDDITTIIEKLNPIVKNKKDNLSKIKGVCSICKELKYCWGACRAYAFAKYGDLNAPYPFCQNLYELGLFPENKIDKSIKYLEFNEVNDDGR